MSGERVMRGALWVAVALNLVGVLVFAPAGPASDPLPHGSTRPRLHS